MRYSLGGREIATVKPLLILSFYLFHEKWLASRRF
jgi:hypothetical protein